MPSPKTRSKLAAVLFTALIGCATPGETRGAELLTVGSPAPALDIEHWVQDGEGAFGPITTFEPGKVYVVEFWATWCPPCVASIPHLSELQQKYADRGVTVVSVSDEDLDTVTGFLQREVKGKTGEDGEPLTFDDFTKVYCLTTDPDGSTNEDYMQAAMQGGIPSAFLVGKDGHIEWIGHPMRIDDPLAQVVADAWDRDAFATEFKAQQELEAAMQEVGQLVRGGKADEARAKLTEIVDKAPTPELKAQANQMLIQVEYMVFQQHVASDQAAAVEQLPKLIEMTNSRPSAINAFTWAVAQQAMEGQTVSDELLSAAEQAIVDVLDEGHREYASLLDTQAHLAYHLGDLDRAITIQSKASEAAEGRLKPQIDAYLEQLRAEKAGGDEESSEEE